MRSIRIATIFFAVILALTGTVSAVAAIVALTQSAWLWAALFGAIAAFIYVIAYWVYRAWRMSAHAADKEHGGASAK
jgi:hypothetical protein